MAPSPDNASAPSPDSSSNSSSSSPPSPPTNNNNSTSSSSPPSPPSSNNNSTSSSSPPPKSSPSPPPKQSPPPSPPPPSANNNDSSPSGGNSSPSPQRSPPSPSQSSSSADSPPTLPKSKLSPPSPPPPSDALTPPSREGKSHSPPSHNSKNNGSNRNDDSSDNSPSVPSSKSSSGLNNQDTMAAIITAALGAVILIMLLIACICCCKKKKKRRHNSMHYYADSGPKGNNSDYYGSAPPKWNNGTQGMDPHAVNKLPPPPGAVAPPPGAWQAPPPPPPMSSSDMSSAFSGPHGPPLPPPSPALALGFNKSTFSYDELAAATGNFSPGNLLGQGGFGYVYKGYLPNGKEIAVKQLKAGSGQGEREFHAEVDIISRVHHRHLVSLVGYCITGAHRMLVYEFVPNNTLEHHLHGKGVPVMEWPTRIKIALGSAKGLAYLHEDCHPRIIHRDIKAANILLDFKFEAMVADFGLAKLSQDNHTHVSTRIMGTFGYLAPEYASSGKLTEKSDVFSYGVMLLELITGRRPVDSSQMEDSLVDWARPLLARALTDGNYDELVDPRLEGKFNPLEMSRMAASAAASVRHSARRRPKMSQIVRALEGDVSLEDLNEGVKPGQSTFFSSSSDYDSSSYSSNMRQFRKVALASTDFSEDYSVGPTSEYGLNPSESSNSGELRGAGSHSQKPHRPL